MHWYLYPEILLSERLSGGKNIGMQILSRSTAMVGTAGNEMELLNASILSFLHVGATLPLSLGAHV